MNDYSTEHNPKNLECEICGLRHFDVRQVAIPRVTKEIKENIIAELKESNFKYIELLNLMYLEYYSTKPVIKDNKFLCTACLDSIITSRKELLLLPDNEHVHVPSFEEEPIYEPPGHKTFAFDAD